MMLTKKWALALVYAFAINFFWEHWHYHLYRPLHPLMQGKYVLWWAALIDAVIILILLKLFHSSHRPGLPILAGVAVAIGIEFTALHFGWWGYTSAMPLVPLLKTGWSPSLQIGVSIYLVLKLAFARINY